MSGSDRCRLFEALLDQSIRDESSLRREDRHLIDTHSAICSPCRLQLALIDRARSSAIVETADDVELRRTFNQIMAAGRAPPGPARRLVVSRWIPIAAASMATLVAVAVLGPRIRSGERSADASPAAGMTRANGVGDASRIVQLSGRIRRGNGYVSQGESLQSEDRVGSEEASVRLVLASGVTVLADVGSLMLVSRIDDYASVFTLKRGRVAFRVPALARGRSFSVATKHGVARVLGTIFAVDLSGRAVDVTVLEGRVAFEQDDGLSAIVGAGHGFHSAKGSRRLWFWRAAPSLQAARALEDPSAVWPTRTSDRSGSQHEPLISPRAGHRPAGRERTNARQGATRPHRGGAGGNAVSHGTGNGPATTAGEELWNVGPRTPASAQVSSRPEKPIGGQASLDALLARARDLQSQGKWKELASTYALLTYSYPESAEAQTCLVLMAKVQLEKVHDPRGALRSLERYLRGRRRGALVQEAMWLKAAALRELGRTEDEIRVLKDFVARYSSSPYAPLAIERLGSLE